MKKFFKCYYINPVLLADYGLCFSHFVHYTSYNQHILPPAYWATIGVIAGVLGVTAGFLLGTGVASSTSDRNQQTFDELRAAVKKNKGSLTESQRFELIRLLSN